MPVERSEYGTRPIIVHDSDRAVWRVTGAFAGMILGLLEAIYLGGHPRPPGLLSPNVTWVIWYLGPLLDGGVGGVLGASTGLVVAARSSGRAWRRAAELLRPHRAGLLTAGICLTAVTFASAAWGNQHALAVPRGGFGIAAPLGRSARGALVASTDSRDDADWRAGRFAGRGRSLLPAPIAYLRKWWRAGRRDKTGIPTSS